ncbi:MAG: type II/IV secretion system ATPase subunit [Candidatus Methanomethylicaceae archaeon]|nr:type II/IV secretion system ATPase subunit [Candidatus Verstraetearchaeota archaeon]
MEFGKFKTHYPIEEPYVYATIVEDPSTKEIKYIAIEPTLTDEDKKVLKKIKEIFLDELDIDLMELSKEEASKILENRIKKIIKEYKINIDEGQFKKILYYLKRDFLGFEKIDPLMKDHYVEDISCDGVGIPIYIWHREFESIKTNIVYESEEELNRFVTRLAYLCGKHISIAQPILDASLPDGSRVNATYGSEISRRGTTFTIRRFRADPLTIIDLIQFGTISIDLAAYLWFIIENKRSILIAGETASGKTTLLNCTSMFIRPDMKIVSIEETPELNLPHTNWIPMVTRTGFGRKSADISLFDLLKNALRQRPDYIIVGEIRGAEAYTLFQALAIGHGIQATIHAESVEKVISRLESPPMNIPKSMIELLDVIIIQSKVKKGSYSVRRTTCLAEIKEYNREKNELIINYLARWDPNEDTHIMEEESVVLNRISEEKGIPMKEIMNNINKRKHILKWMVNKGMRRYMEIGSILREYYTDSEGVFRRALVEIT